ncbi:hypothetical protein JE599_001890 [Salmonella enterica]|nr:hypothetical protein [Salmonella enterica]
MSIPVQTPFNLYIANGSTTVFPYRFLLNQASDLRITANGRTVSAGFSVSGEGNQSGGQITFSTPPASGTKIAILRNIPLRRDTEYQDNGDLLASTINADFDRLWMAIQGVDAVKDLALSRSGQDVSYYDAKGMPVKNLKDPADPQDAVTKSVLDSAVVSMEQQVQEAKTHLDVVWQSVSQNAISAKQSEVNSDTSEKLAAQHAKDALDTLTKTQKAASTAAADAVASAVPAAAQQIRSEIHADVTRAEQSSTLAADSAMAAASSEQQAAQALKEAQEIAKTPGPKGDPGKDGLSAYDVWVSQQPTGSDTSMAAYMEYQKGNSGGGSDVNPAYVRREKLTDGTDLNNLTGDDKEGIYPFDEMGNLGNYPEEGSSSYLKVGGVVQVQKLNDGYFVQNITQAAGGKWTRVYRVPGLYAFGGDDYTNDGFSDWLRVTSNRNHLGYARYDYPGSYVLAAVNPAYDLPDYGQDDDGSIAYPIVIEGQHLNPVSLSVTASGEIAHDVINPGLPGASLLGTWEIHSFLDWTRGNSSIVLALRTR